ncbi:MAG: response regulator [Pseudomonadota bacterium]|nr:response regulator [Pseudomonadota bacterium]
MLIVEDQAPMRAALCDLIETWFPKLRVIHAPDGATARKLFDARRPAFVLVDKNLPDANGLDLARTIKKLSPATMIAVTSVETNAHIAAQARAAGAVAFIGKDRLFDELRPLIGAAVTLMEWMHGNASSSLVPADSPQNG